ncbi:MAG: hypothetical protein HRU09_11770 [Oligoflexales bacterium]|nr:hypothetical protein [Oligoflexales bacterium]
MYFYNRKADYKVAKAKLKLRRNQHAIIDALYEKAVIKHPELKDEIESQVNDFRNYQTSIDLKPVNDNFDSIVYDADEEFRYLVTELKKYVDKEECKKLDRTYGTIFFT